MRCWVPGCKSGSVSKKNQDSCVKKIHLFQPRTEEARNHWQAAIKKKWDKRGSLKQLSIKSKICSLHFVDSDVELTYTHVINGQVVEIPRDRAKLKPGAVPHVFPEYPTAKKRKDPATRVANKQNSKIVLNNTLKNVDINASEDVEENTCASSTGTEMIDALHHSITIQPADHEKDNNTLENVDVDASEDVKDNTWVSSTGTELIDPLHDSITLHSADYEEENNTATEVIPLEKKWSHELINELSLPVDWIVCNTTSLTQKIAVHIDRKKLIIDKSVNFSGSSAPEIIFRGSVKLNIFQKDLHFMKDVQKLINTVHMMKVCDGTSVKDNPFSVSCLGAVSLRARRCKHCAAEKDRLRKIYLRRETIKKRQEKTKTKTKNRIKSLERSKINLLLKVQKYRTMLGRTMRVKKMSQTMRKSSLGVASPPPASKLRTLYSLNTFKYM